MPVPKAQAVPKGAVQRDGGGKGAGVGEAGG